MLEKYLSKWQDVTTQPVRTIGEAYDYRQDKGRWGDSVITNPVEDVATKAEQNLKSLSNVDQGNDPMNPEDGGPPIGHPMRAQWEAQKYGSGNLNLNEVGGLASTGLGVLQGGLSMFNPLVTGMSALANAEAGEDLFNFGKDYLGQARSDAGKFLKSIPENFSDEGRQKFYDRVDYDSGRDKARWGDWYEDNQGNIVQKHATWQDTKKWLSGDTTIGGKLTAQGKAKAAEEEKKKAAAVKAAQAKVAADNAARKARYQQEDNSDSHHGSGTVWENPTSSYSSSASAHEAQASANSGRTDGGWGWNQGGMIPNLEDLMPDPFEPGYFRSGGAVCNVSQYKNEGGRLSKKISKLHDEGYDAPGQAYAIAKSMGYSAGGKVDERVGPLAKTIFKGKDGESWERHYHDPTKPKGGNNAQTKEGNGAGSVRK